MIFNTKSKKGYFTLEAAIFLPIFIVGVLTLGYCIKLYSTADHVAFALLDETGHLAARAYGIEEAPFFRHRLKQRLEQENNGVEQMQAIGFRYLYREGNRDGLISAGCQYRLRLALPFDAWDAFEMESKVRCRGFIGKRSQGTPMGFDEMEKNGDGNFVWIFPAWGNRYHSETCAYIKAHARQMVLTRELKSKYRACELCEPGNLPIGVYVYCFPDTGEAYHRESCKMIEKYTIEIEKEDAVAKGYQPCSKCGGE